MLAQTIAVILALVLASVLVKEDRRPLFVVLFLSAHLVSRFVIRLPLVLDLHLGLRHNWVGHILVIAWVLLFLKMGPIGAKEIGLTWKQDPGTTVPALMITAGVVAFKGILAALSPAGPPGGRMAETLLFQITMPPLAQELLYTGLLLTLAVVALGGTIGDRAPAWDRVTVLAVLVAAFSHGIGFSLLHETGLQFHPGLFMIPFLGKVVYASLRLYTGSLLFPMLAYSISNLVVWMVMHR